MAAGDITVGRRSDAQLWEMEPGDYSVRKNADTGEHVAWVVTPNCQGPACLEGWELLEHVDGTITVSPSILAHPTETLPGWHGFLEQGVWREV